MSALVASAELDPDLDLVGWVQGLVKGPVPAALASAWVEAVLVTEV